MIDRKLADVISEVEEKLTSMKFDSGYLVKLAGESEEMNKSFNSLRFALICHLSWCI